MKWVKDIWNSLNTDKGGLSGRKVSAAICVITAVYLAVEKVPAEQKLYCVYAFLVFAGTCLGLVTIPDLIKFLSAKGYVQTTTTTQEVKEDKSTQ